MAFDVTFDIETAEGKGQIVFNVEDREQLLGRVMKISFPSPEVEELWQDLTAGGNPLNLKIGGGTEPDNILRYFDGVGSVLAAMDAKIREQGGAGMLIETSGRLGAFKGSERGVIG